jgi:hypothetical protein
VTAGAVRLAIAVTAAAGFLGASPQAPVRPVDQPPGEAQSDGRAAVPWTVGERLSYDVKFGPVKVGNATMEVRGIEDVRGREAYHTVLRIKGGTFLYKVDDLLESWIDTRTLNSLRFHKDQNEGRREKEIMIELFPERQTFTENDKPEVPSVESPLDDGSFLFYVRTLPLRPGETYESSRYFRPDRNPVRIRVLRRERVTVPAGTFDAVVVQPSIKTKGIFSEGGRAEVWFSDDADRIMLQMKSSLSFGSLNLYLKSRQSGNR